MAAASRLAEPLRRGKVRPGDLAAVRRRRLLPTVLVQGLHRMMHRVIVTPVLDRREPRASAMARR